LVDDLLDVSRIRRGRGELQRERLQVSALANEIGQKGKRPANQPAVVARRILVVDDYISGTALVSRLLMKLGPMKSTRLTMPRPPCSSRPRLVRKSCCSTSAFPGMDG